MTSSRRWLQEKPAKGSAHAAKVAISNAGLSPERMASWADQHLIRLMNLESNAVTNRVRRVVELCKTASELTEKIRISPSERRRFTEERNAVLDDLNARLAKFSWHPRISGYLGHATHFGVSYESKPGSDAAEFENRAVMWITSNIDTVHRIRQCHRLDCRLWFFAVTEHQKYCGENCRKREMAQGEVFKAKRRIYMRNRRKDEKAKDVRMLKLARRE